MPALVASCVWQQMLMGAGMLFTFTRMGPIVVRLLGPCRKTFLGTSYGSKQKISPLVEIIPSAPPKQPVGHTDGIGSEASEGCSIPLAGDITK